MVAVEPMNYAAIALYRALGFQLEAEISDYFGPGEHRLLLELSLHAVAVPASRPPSDSATTT
jgi:ribosomal protein S18 acetylase RimI-like enzyme